MKDHKNKQPEHVAIIAPGSNPLVQRMFAVDSFFEQSAIVHEDAGIHLPHPTHKYFYIIVWLNGEGVFKIRNEEYSLTPSAVLLINPEEEHYFAVDDPAISRMNTHMFTIPQMKDFIITLKKNDENLTQIKALNEPEAFNFTKAYYRSEPGIVHISNQIMDILFEKNNRIAPDYANELYRNELLYLLFNREFHQFIINSNSNQEESENIKDITLRCKAAEIYIRDNLDKKITIQDLAQVTGLSTSHFARVFTQRMGISPYRYILRLRIEKAKTLLKTTDQSITSIAHQLGYPTLESFIKAFKSVVGAAPRDFRKQNEMV